MYKHNIEIGLPIGDQQKNLLTIFSTIQTGQLNFLDLAGKRIIELSTGLLALLFTIISIGDKFPSENIQNNYASKILILIALALYLLAILAGIITIQPKKYIYQEYNLSSMKLTLSEIIRFKSLWMKMASLLFFLGSLALTLLIYMLILYV